MQTELRVAVADDHPLFRDGVAEVVGQHPELALAGVASTGPEALDLLRTERPDVAVLDLNLPGLHGREIVEAAAREDLPVRALVLSGFADAALVQAVLGAGAYGYLTKGAHPQEIVSAIVAVGRGETVLGSEVQGALAAQLRRDRREARQVLTGRETDVLRLLADGLSAAQIGRELSISVTTVKSHLQHVYDKLGVSTGAAAVGQGLRRGILV